MQRGRDSALQLICITVAAFIIIISDYPADHLRNLACRFWRTVYHEQSGREVRQCDVRVNNNAVVTRLRSCIVLVNADLHLSWRSSFRGRWSMQAPCMLQPRYVPLIKRGLCEDEEVGA